VAADAYVEDDARGQAWQLRLGDACERIAEIDDGSVGLSIHSPPFASLYTYSPSIRDLGNCADRDEFFMHYGYVIDGLLRATQPGRLACVHVQQLSTTKATHGEMGLTDFRGQVIAAYQSAGWVYYGEVTVDKDPQAQAIRTKAHALMFNTLERDSAGTRPALADYVILFRKRGKNEVPIKPDVDRETWIEWARPVWYGIREDPDERHIAPLQLNLIERCVRLWSNREELVFTPCAGIGSEVYMAVKLGRRGAGIELKASYWRAAVENLRSLERQAAFEGLA
jgi:hypothetical protein